MRMSICVEFASIEFSMSSFRALDGRWMTSPAAILSTTYDLGGRSEKGEDPFVETFDGFDDGVRVGMGTFLASRGGW